MIKLVVGIDDLPHFYEVQQTCVFNYHGVPANAVRTRFKPKRAEEVLAGGSLYRVIKNRIQCRQEIIGFESEDSPDKGTQCLIIVSNTIYQTVSTPKKPFQGWRYLNEVDIPRDRGVYQGENISAEPVPEDMEDDLKEMGLI
ncbi:MAG: DUF1489 domain-containing protein [Alphaproteobacteria bacterium]|nr:DUF1489 domain-containing protein [Alphaproteobacteria bacterium]